MRKLLKQHRPALKITSIILLIVYLICFMLKMTGIFNINYIICIIPILAIILQSYIILTGVIEESCCQGKNVNVNLLLLWVMFFIVTFF